MYKATPHLPGYGRMRGNSAQIRRIRILTERQRKIESIHIDFDRDNLLPHLNDEDLAELGKVSKPVVLTKKALDRNLGRHKEVPPSAYDHIISQALYDSDDRFGGREIHDPNYINFVKYEGERALLVTINLSAQKECYEIVHLFETSAKKIEKMKPKKLS
jgi:hypothetical protein